MSAGDRDMLALAELLHKHRHNLGVCTCGYGEGKRWGIDEVLHRAHVADVLLASDWLTDRDQRVMRELRTFLPEWGYPDYVVAAICLELQERVPESYRTTEDTDAH